MSELVLSLQIASPDGGTEPLHAPPGLRPAPLQALRRRRTPQRGPAERARLAVAAVVVTMVMVMVMVIVIVIVSYPSIKAFPVVHVAAAPEHPHLVALHQRAEADRARVAAARLQYLDRDVSVSGERKTVFEDLRGRAR